MRERDVQTVALTLVVCALICAIIIPAFLPGRSSAPPPEHRCGRNLWMIDSAKDYYASKHDPLPADTVLTASNMAAFTQTLGDRFCPLAKGTNRTFENSYAINDLTSPPTCLIAPKEHVLP